MFVEATAIYRHIPQGHFYERLASLLDLSFIAELTRPLYADQLGRPSLDPVVFFQCMLIGFFENIVYDTELEYRIADFADAARASWATRSKSAPPTRAPCARQGSGCRRRYSTPCSPGCWISARRRGC